MTTRSETGPDNDVSPYFWVPAACFAAFMFVYVLVHAAMLTDGFLQSCRQYRNELLKHMRASGPMVLAVQGRLSWRPYLILWTFYIRTCPLIDVESIA